MSKLGEWTGEREKKRREGKEEEVEK